MKESPAPYSVEPLGKGIVALVSKATEAPYNCIHTAGYGNTSGYGPLTYWESVAGGSQWHVQTYDDTGIDITPADLEPLSRMAEGFYDLTGRRIAHPTSGIYISKVKDKQF